MGVMDGNFRKYCTPQTSDLYDLFLLHTLHDRDLPGGADQYDLAHVREWEL